MFKVMPNNTGPVYASAHERKTETVSTKLIDTISQTTDPVSCIIMWEYIMDNLDPAQVSEIFSAVKDSLAESMTTADAKVYFEYNSRKTSIYEEFGQIRKYGRQLSDQERTVVHMTSGMIPWQTGISSFRKNSGDKDWVVALEKISTIRIRLEKLEGTWDT